MASEGAESRLAATISADVVGCSRLMFEAETSTIQTDSPCRSLISDLVNHHHDRLVDAPGEDVSAGTPEEETPC